MHAGREIPFSVTVGVACTGPDQSIDACLRAADGALLQGKREGKNRVIAAPTPGLASA